MIDALTTKALGALAVAAALSGCAALDRTRAGDMSVPEHERAARLDLLEAEKATRAAAEGGRSEAFQRYSERRHRQLAAEHAAAAVARRAMVSDACAGADPAATLASFRMAVVEPIRESPVPKRLRNARGFYPERLRGARIEIPTGEQDATGRAVAARSIECEAGRAAAGLGPPDARSPFAVTTAQARVQTTGGRIVVEVRGNPGGTAEEILRRAYSLRDAQPRSDG